MDFAPGDPVLILMPHLLVTGLTGSASGELARCAADICWAQIGPINHMHFGWSESDKVTYGIN